MWTLPRVTSSCPTTCTYGIWSGLTDVWNGNHLAQTGFGADTSTSGSTYYLWYQFVPVNSTATNCSFTLTPGDHILSGTYSDANTSPTGSPSSYNVDTLDSTIGRACQTYHYNWSTGLGANSYFALLVGEVKQITIPNFGQVTISGTIYDNHYNGGPLGHCISTPYNNGWANSFYIVSGGHKATESLDSGSCTFKDDYW